MLTETKRTDLFCEYYAKWNGEVYEIDRVKYCCRAASTKVGGTGLRYTVLICGTETYLVDEENGKWFVEGKNRAVL